MHKHISLSPFNPFFYIGTTFYCLENDQINEISADSGTIKTVYDGESTYRNNQKCSWFVNAGVNNNTKVQFKVTNNELEWVPENSICIGYDYLQIRTGMSL